MPCVNDYMEPSPRERALQLAARLLCYVREQTGGMITGTLRESAGSPYCRVDYVPTLCDELTRMNAEKFEALVYDAHNRTARALADWWEDHQKADVERTEKEARRKQALDKLTPEDRKVLGLE